MNCILVDSNVILDLVTEDPSWFHWSSTAIERCGDTHMLAIDPTVYAEISVRFETIEALDDAIPPTYFARLPLPWEAGFLAGKCFERYRRLGGTRRSPLPDFYIGAHAAVRGMPLLTRDIGRYQAYFPKLEVIHPGMG